MRKQQGTVFIEVLVDVKGTPKSIKIDRSSGFKVLDVAALEAIEKWTFVPAHRGSKIVEASVVVPIEFRIN